MRILMFLFLNLACFFVLSAQSDAELVELYRKSIKELREELRLEKIAVKAYHDRLEATIRNGNLSLDSVKKVFSNLLAERDEKLAKMYIRLQTTKSALKRAKIAAEMVKKSAEASEKVLKQATEINTMALEDAKKTLKNVSDLMNGTVIELESDIFRLHALVVKHSIKIYISKKDNSSTDFIRINDTDNPVLERSKKVKQLSFKFDTGDEFEGESPAYFYKLVYLDEDTEIESQEIQMKKGKGNVRLVINQPKRTKSYKLKPGNYQLVIYPSTRKFEYIEAFILKR
jgi:hypothetical protein